jgi:hypothetical protein
MSEHDRHRPASKYAQSTGQGYAARSIAPVVEWAAGRIETSCPLATPVVE